MFCRDACSNRTFMELKLEIVQSFIYSVSSSNRTFMELKLTTTMVMITRLTVLIVPLWN